MTITAFRKTLQTSDEWMQDLAADGGLADEEQACAALRSVLHALRDRLTVEESAHVSAQLPLLIRGMFFEGWTPARQPVRLRSRQEFLDAVHEELDGGPNRVDAETATREVFGLLDRRLTAGQAQHVRDLLPEAVETLWP